MGKMIKYVSQNDKNVLKFLNGGAPDSNTILNCKFPNNEINITFTVYLLSVNKHVLVIGSSFRCKLH